MDQETVDGIWDDLHQRLGESLRGVTMYEGIHQVSTLRDDIRDQYSEQVSERMADENLVDRFSEERLSEAIQAGALEVVVRFYPEFLLLAWSPEEEPDRGVLVAYDRPTDREGKLVLFDVVAYMDDFAPSVFE